MRPVTSYESALMQPQRVGRSVPLLCARSAATVMARMPEWHFSYVASWCSPGEAFIRSAYRRDFNSTRLEVAMGKYVIGWILGVPAIVLVVAYFFFR